MDTPTSIQKKTIPPQLQKLAKWVKLMDSQWRIPGTNITFGLDPVLDLIPGLGTLVDYGISAYLMFALWKNGSSSKLLLKMFTNITIDGIVGAIPVLGNIFDVFYKANRKNLVLAVEHYEEGKHSGSALPYLIPVLIVLALVFIGLAFCSYFALKFIFGFLGSMSLS